MKVTNKNAAKFNKHGLKLAFNTFVFTICTAPYCTVQHDYYVLNSAVLYSDELYCTEL